MRQAKPCVAPLTRRLKPTKIIPVVKRGCGHGAGGIVISARSAGGNPYEFSDCSVGARGRGGGRCSNSAEVAWSTRTGIGNEEIRSYVFDRLFRRCMGGREPRSEECL